MLRPLLANPRYLCYVEGSKTQENAVFAFAELLDQTFLGISLAQYGGAFGAILGALIIRRIALYFYDRLLLPLAEKTGSEYDDLLLKCLRRPAGFLVTIGGIRLALDILKLPSEPVNLLHFGNALTQVLLTFTIAWTLFNLIDIFDKYLSNWAARTVSTLDDNLTPLIRKSLRVFIVFLALIMTIQNFGYSVSGLLASLGIGGLAVALAAKDTLSNVFGSLMIIFDRPFRVGDWIVAGDMEGTVEEVGFRSTKIRTFAKTQITVPNNIVANLGINNFSRMPKRRIKLTVGITYATTPQQMRTVVERIRTLLREHPAIDQEFFLVNFTDFGASSLDIMVYCFTTTTVWGEYLDARQDVCLKIMDILEELGLEIAFPSRSLYVEKMPGDGLPGPAHGAPITTNEKGKA
ncbi:MAG: mechanosensitive ion channel family protein [Desulfuromonadaceae bacterium]|nr:mechanosensitive ion channel family protein [Desulfuromonadaceae bacterium]